MKFIRGLYVYTMYVLGLPFFILMLLGLTVYNVYTTLRYGNGFKDLLSGFQAIGSGLRFGHMVNKSFIKYGRKGCDISDWEIE